MLDSESGSDRDGIAREGVGVCGWVERWGATRERAWVPTHWQASIEAPAAIFKVLHSLSHLPVPLVLLAGRLRVGVNDEGSMRGAVSRSAPGRPG